MHTSDIAGANPTKSNFTIMYLSESVCVYLYVYAKLLIILVFVVNHNTTKAFTLLKVGHQTTFPIIH